MLLYRLPIACWRTDERVDSRVLAAVSECSIGTVSEGLGRWRFTCEPARPLCGSWFRCTLERPARSIALLLPRSRHPGAGRSTRVSHIALALLDALVSSIAFSCLLRSLRALILLCPSATPQFSPRASRLPGAAARRCVARVGRRGRRARSGGARGGGGAAGPDGRSRGPYKHTLVSITFRGYRTARTRSRVRATGARV